MTPESAPTVDSVLEEATRVLHEAGLPDARREAVALLAFALGVDRGGVAARKPDPIAAAVAARFGELVAGRARRVPPQQLEGRAEFRGLTFEVSADVLIPRPETEQLVQAVLDAGLPDRARIADLGTGSGCVAVTLATLRPSWTALAIDLSPEAARIATRNASRHGVASRVDVRVLDFAAVPDQERGAYDGVVSNPPYVAEAEWSGLQPEVRDHEPRIALVPGPTGNEAYETVCRSASLMLRPGGLLALELGWKSEAAVRARVAERGFREISVIPDLQGIPRVLTARR